MIKKINGKYFVYSKDGTKKLGGPYKSKEEALKRLRQIEFFKKQKESLMWEVQNFEIKESKDETSDVIEVYGTALEDGKSKNNRNYSFNNLKENDGKSFNWIVGHKEDYDNPDHNVGDGSLSLENNRLKFNGRIINTNKHPDIIRQVKEGLVGPSIQGYGDISVVKEKGSISFNVENLRIPLIALVNKYVRGVESASIEAAIAESLRKEVNELNNKEETHEVENMSEEKDVNKLEESIKKKDEEIMKLKESIDKKNKESIIEKIVSLNEKLNKDDLFKKSVEELNLMLEYEQKLKESERNDEAISQVNESDDKDKAEEKFDGIKYNRKTGDITMSEEMYEKYNKDMINSIYR